MLRNFGILKIQLSFPTLSDQNNTGPFEVRRTINAIAIRGKKRKIINTIARFKSSNLFITKFNTN
jgi:hypothetical protein